MTTYEQLLSRALLDESNHAQPNEERMARLADRLESSQKHGDDYQRALSVLAWCKTHDWGRDALLRSEHGRYVIAELRDSYVDGQGEARETRVTLRADLRIIRPWAGY